jgi:hypothetical protein
VFQINCDIFATSQHHIPVRTANRRIAYRLHTVNAHDLGAHITEHHCRKWSWPNASNLNYFVAG